MEGQNVKSVQVMQKLKSRLKEIEDQPGFNKENQIYLALKEKIENLDKVIMK